MIENEKPGVHLITFGGGGFEYRRSVTRLIRQARKSSLFATTLGITDLTFPKYHPVAWKQHSNFMLESPLGYGYWIWKAIICEKRLLEIPTGDILVYLDSGCELNLVSENAILRFNEYLEEVRIHGSLAMQMRDAQGDHLGFKEKYYSKSMLVAELNPTEATLNSNQLLAGVLIMKNCESNVDFLREWLSVAVRHEYALLTNDLLSEEIVGFQSHRNDQSIFSILYKEQKRHYILDETYWKPDWKIRGRDFPIWTIRNRSGIARGPMKTPDAIDSLYLSMKRLKGWLSARGIGVSNIRA